MIRGTGMGLAELMEELAWCFLCGERGIAWMFIIMMHASVSAWHSEDLITSFSFLDKEQATSLIGDYYAIIQLSPFGHACISSTSAVINNLMIAR